MSIDYARIAENQFICQITDLPESNKDSNACLIVLFDISHSMGSYVRHFHTALKSVLAETSYKKIEIVSFGINAHRFTTNPESIHRWRCPATEGATRMFDATKTVMSIFNDSPAALFQFLIISDGEIHDMTEGTFKIAPKACVINLINNIDPVHFARHTIQVAGIRLGKEGSTRAMSCFFKYHSYTTAPYLKDIYHDVADVHISILEIFEIFKNNLVNSYHDLISPGDHCLSTDPMSKASNHVLVRNGSWFVSTIDPDQLEITGLNVRSQAHLKFSEQDILPFMKILESKVKNFKILEDNRALKNMELFLTRVGSVMLEAETESDSGIRGKISRIRRDVCKTQKNILARIRTLLNTDSVNRLNAQQQANFLRQVDSDKRNARRLARRHGDADTHAVLISEIKKRKNAFDATADDDHASFMSMCSTQEILNDSLDELHAPVDGELTMNIIPAEQLLQVIGAVGICFQGAVGDYPDPWQYRVAKVFPDILLGQHELWESTQHTNQDAINQHPTIRSLRSQGGSGKNTRITGVDVLVSSTANRFYLTKMRRLNQIHSSISMRRVISLIPNDAIALKTAVVFQQLLQIMEQPSEIGIKQCWLNIQSLKLIAHPNVFDSDFNQYMQEELLSQNPRFARFWTGDLDISGILKPIAFMLICDHGSALSSTELDLFNLELYHTMRSLVAQSETDNPLEIRNDLISRILDISSDHKTRPQSPGTPEPETVCFYDEFNETHVIQQALKILDASKIYKKISALYTALRAFWASKTDSEFATLVRNSSSSDPLGADSELFYAASVLQAVKHSKLSDRINNRQLLTKLFLTRADCVAFIKNTVREQYESSYNKMLSAKIKREEEQRVKLAVETLVYTSDMQEFLETLNKQIPDRSSPGYIDLLQEMQMENIPIRFEKLWILVFARSVGFNPDIHDTADQDWIVWNLGNVMSVDDIKYAEAILAQNNTLGDLQLTWTEFKDLYRRMGYVPHVYRVSDIPNRHGHCNSTPYIPREFNL